MINNGEVNDQDIEELLDDSMVVVEGDRFEDDIDKQSLSDSEFDELQEADYDMTGSAFWRPSVEVGDTGYGNSQWDDGATVDEVTREGGLAKRRGLLQPWTDQAMNAIGQAVVAEGIGGIIEGAGYLMDWEGIYNIVNGKEKEYSNWLSDLGSALKEKVQENTAIYERSPGKIDMFDSGFWFKNAVSVASTLSIMIPGMAGAKLAKYAGKFLAKTVAKGVNKGAKLLGKGHIAADAAKNGVQLGVKTAWATDGVTQAIVSRHIENTMEAHGTMEGIVQDRLSSGAINKETGKPYTEEEARAEGAVAASENYKLGWAMLGQDMFQYLSIGKVFNPVTKQMVLANRFQKAGSRIGKKTKKALSIGKSFASEALEEGYQSIISTNAALKVDYEAGLISESELYEARRGMFTSDEMKTSMLFGGLGGSFFDFAGPKFNDLMKSKSRKELEENAENWRKMNFKDQFNFYSALHKKKQAAETAGDKAGRQMSQDSVLSAMIIDGIDNNNLEEVMEGILAGKDMTPEQKAQFEAEHGGEWSQELAEEGATRALEMSKKIQEMHFKTRSKKSNKGVPESIMKAQTMAEFQSENLTKEQERLGKESQEIFDNIKFDENNKPTQEWLEYNKTNLDVAGQDVYINVLKKLQSEAKGKDKDLITEQLKVARAQKRKLKRDFKAQETAKKEAAKRIAAEQKIQDKEATKNMTPAQKKKYMAEKVEEVEAQAIVDKNNKEAYASAEQSILTNSVEQKINGLKITMNNSKMAILSSKEHAVEVKKDNNSRVVASLKTQEEVEKFAKMIEKDSFIGSEYSEEERKELEAQLVARSTQIKKKIEDDKVIEENKEAAAELAKKTKEKNEDITIPDNNVNNEVTNILEDQHKDEEIQTEEKVTVKEEQTLEIQTGNGKSVAPLDNSQGTLKAYKNWLLDGTKKIGQIVGYRVAKRGPHKNPKSRSTSKAYQAIVEFGAAMREFQKTGVMPQLSDFVIDHYPIELYVKDGSENGDKKKVTDVASLDSSRSSEEQIKRYKESTRPERSAILNALLQGKEPISVITHSGGGQLQTEKNSDGSKAVNGIREVEQFSDPESEVTVMYTNERGELMQSDKKDLQPEFLGTTFSAGKDDSDNNRPYSGGVFIMVKKADGTPFPVKVNNLKNTQGQAEVLADLLLGIAIPPGVKDPSTGKYPTRELSMKETRINELPQELQDRVRAEFAPEIEMIGDSATLSELLGNVTFLSDKTEGMTTSLMFKGVRLSFGATGNEITPENMSEDKRDELVEFLRDVKARPFSLERWNNTKKYKGYRNYVLENKIINTDMVTEGPLFKSSDPGLDGKVERRVQIYVEPLAPKTSEESKKGKNLAEIKESTTSDDLVDDPTASAPSFSVEANKEIADKFPEMNYHFGIHNGNKTVFGVVIPDADLKALKEIKEKYEAKGKQVISETKTSDKSAQLADHMKEGGSTFTPDGKNLRGTEGFSVSTHLDLTKSIPGNNLTEKDIADFIEKNKILLGVDPSLSIGTWYNEKTNTTMIDVVSIEPDLDKAIALGKKHNQIAIYSLSAGHAINTGGTGKVVKPVPKKKDSIQKMVDERSKRFMDLVQDDTFAVEDKIKALNKMMNTLAHSAPYGVTADFETLSMLAKITELGESLGYQLKSQIGRELSKNEVYSVGWERSSDNVPAGVQIISNIVTPEKRDPNTDKIITNGKYDIITGTGTNPVREGLQKNIEVAEDALLDNPGNMEENIDAFRKAQDALQEYDLVEYPESNRMARDTNDSAPTQTNEVLVDESLDVEFEDTMQAELEEAKEQLSFSLDRLKETESKLDVATYRMQKRAAEARYMEKVSDIRSKYSIEKAQPKANVENAKPEEKTPEMNEIETKDSNVQFSLFDNTWDTVVDGEVVASGVTKEEAVEKANDHKETSEKIEKKETNVTHTVNGRSQTYSVKNGVITNSKGKEVFAKNGKNRTAILESAEKNIEKLEKSLEPVLPLELTDQEWQDFIAKGSVTDTRLRALKAKEESGAVMDLRENTILESYVDRINEAKGNVSENGDTKISKANKKAVSSQTEGSTGSKLHSTEVSINTDGIVVNRKRRKSKQEKIKGQESTPPTTEQIQGIKEEGKEDTTC